MSDSLKRKHQESDIEESNKTHKANDENEGQHVIENGHIHDSETNINRFFKSRLAQKWVRYEWFYSPIDELVIKDSDFTTCLKEVGIEHQYLTRLQWASVRRRLGKPRRFSRKFFQEENEICQRKRQIIQTLQEVYPNIETTFIPKSQVPPEIPIPFYVGQRVTVRHPFCHDQYQKEILVMKSGLLTAQIVSNQKDGFILVSFEDERFGTQLISCLDVVPHDKQKKVSCKELMEPSLRHKVEKLAKNSKHSVSSSTLDVVGAIMATVRLMKLKMNLIAILKDINAEATNKIKILKPNQPWEFSKAFRDEYHFIVNQLQKLNKAIEPAFPQIANKIDLIPQPERDHQEDERLADSMIQDTITRLTKAEEPETPIEKVDALTLLASVTQVTENKLWSQENISNFPNEPVQETRNQAKNVISNCISALVSLRSFSDPAQVSKRESTEEKTDSIMEELAKTENSSQFTKVSKTFQTIKLHSQGLL